MAIKVNKNNNKNNAKTAKSQERDVFGTFGNKSGSFQTGSGGQRCTKEGKQKETEKIKTFAETEKTKLKLKIKMSPTNRKTKGKKVGKSVSDAEGATAPDPDVKTPPARGTLELDNWTKKTLRHERRLSRIIKLAAKDGSWNEDKLAEAKEKLKALKQKRVNCTTYCDICQTVQGSHTTRFCPTLKCLSCGEMGHGKPDFPFKTDVSDSNSDDEVDDSDTEGSNGEKSVAEAATSRSTTSDPEESAPDAPKEPPGPDETDESESNEDDEKDIIEIRQTRKERKLSWKKPSSILFKASSPRLRPRKP
jgi:hypothetical protein